MPAPEFITITIGTRSNPTKSIIATRLIRAVDPTVAPVFESFLADKKATWVSEMPTFELNGWRYFTQSRGYTKEMKRVNIEEAAGNNSNPEWHDVDDVAARDAWIAHIELHVDEIRAAFTDLHVNLSAIAFDGGHTIGVHESVSELTGLLDSRGTRRYK